MRLNMAMIARYLTKYNPECHIIEDALTIRGVRFFAEQQLEFSRDYVYLGGANGYFQDPRYQGALLLANGQNQIICRGAEYETLLNDVLSAFDYYGNLEQKLLIAATEHSTLQEIMIIIEQVQSAPFLVFDLDGNLLAIANENAVQDRQLLENMKTKKTLGCNVIGKEFVDKNGKVSHDLANYPQSLYATEQEDMGAVAMYICQGEERVGFVLMLPSSDLETSVGMGLEPIYTNACSQAAEFTERTSIWQGNRSILLRLLRGEVITDPVVDHFVKRLKLSTNPMLLVIRSITIQNYTLRHLLMKEIDEPHITGIACEVDDLVAVLTDEEHQKEVLELIYRKMNRKNIAIGVSMPVQDIEQLHLAYQQAVFAVDASDAPGVRYCKNLALSYLLDILCKEKAVQNFMHPVCFLLEKYDEENKTELFRTLQIFLRSGCNQTETANQMHIHLNTLKYRLRRIEELSNINYKNYDELFFMELSFAMLKQIRKK